MTSPAVGTGIVAFIEARLDEREAHVREWQAALDADEASPRAEGVPSWVIMAGGLVVPAEALAQVAKDRAILALHRPHNCIAHQRQECANCVNDPYPCQTVRLLAAIDADHPDYDPDWKPVAT